VINILLDFVFVRILGIPVWGLAAAFSFSYLLQVTVLGIVMWKRKFSGASAGLLVPFVKSLVAAFTAGVAMYLTVKVFDKSVWVKKLSFLGKLGLEGTVPWQKFVLDTRYTANLLILTTFAVLVGLLTYLLISAIFKSKELAYFVNFTKRFLSGNKPRLVSSEAVEVEGLDNV
jgi:hypothetical protein